MGLGLVLFNPTLHIINDAIEHTLSKFADDTNLNAAAKTLEDRSKIKNYLDKLGKWPEINK